MFHQAAIRITQCAEEPRLALDVLVNGTFNVLEAAVKAGVSKVVAASSASVYGLAETLPDHRERITPTTTARSTARPRRSTRACCAASTTCTGSTTSRCATSTSTGRAWTCYGAYTEVLIRWMERIAAGQPPLIFGDGTQTMDFVHVRRHRARQLLAAKSDVTDEVFNVASGTETSLRELAEAARASWARRSSRIEHARGAQGQPA